MLKEKNSYNSGVTHSNIDISLPSQPELPGPKGNPHWAQIFPLFKLKCIASLFSQGKLPADSHLENT